MSGMTTSDLASYYQSTVANGDYGTASTLGQQQRLAARMKLVMNQMPQLSQDPSALMAIVTSPYSDADLAGHTAAIGAAQSLDGFLSVLKDASPAGQRALYNQMTTQQQAAAAQLGYAPPRNDEGNFFSGVLGPVAGPVGGLIGDVFHAGSTAVGAVAGPVLGGLQWVADQPAHAYRAIVTDNSAIPLLAAEERRSEGWRLHRSPEASASRLRLLLSEAARSLAPPPAPPSPTLPTGGTPTSPPGTASGPSALTLKELREDC